MNLVRHLCSGNELGLTKIDDLKQGFNSYDNHGRQKISETGISDMYVLISGRFS